MIGPPYRRATGSGILILISMAARVAVGRIFMSWRETRSAQFECQRGPFGNFQLDPLFSVCVMCRDAHKCTRAALPCADAAKGRYAARRVATRLRALATLRQTRLKEASPIGQAPGRRARCPTLTRRSIMKTTLVLAATGIALLGGCSKSASQPADTTSSVSGALSVASFPSKPSAVDAVDETGASVRATVDASGRFQLSLAKAHTYRFAVVLAAGSEPLVFPRVSKRLDTTIHVSSGAATVALGAIRHLDAAPTGGFFVVTPTTGTAGTTAAGEASNEGNASECVAGFVQSTGAACADDDTTVTCDNGTGQNDNGADGECVDGKDTTTGLACTDPQPGADPSRSRGHPRHCPLVPTHSGDARGHYAENRPRSRRRRRGTMDATLRRGD